MDASTMKNSCFSRLVFKFALCKTQNASEKFKDYNEIFMENYLKNIDTAAHSLNIIPEISPVIYFRDRCPKNLFCKSYQFSEKEENLQ